MHRTKSFRNFPLEIIFHKIKTTSILFESVRSTVKGFTLQLKGQGPAWYYLIIRFDTVDFDDQSMFTVAGK